MQLSSSGSQRLLKAYVTDSSNANFSCDSISNFIEENIDYNIDASARTLLINMSNQSKNTHIPKEAVSTLIPKVSRI